MTTTDRRTFLGATLAAGAGLALSSRRAGAADSGLDPVYRQVEAQHAASLARLQAWIRQPSIAAENRGMNEGCELMVQLAREAGFATAERVATDGQPGVFGILDAGAPRTVALYFMYDVKQADPKEWSSPPWDAAIVDVPKLGRSVMGRGAVNQKGPQAAFLAALHAISGAGRRPPVNLVLVAEGEEEIGSPHFAQFVGREKVRAALAKSIGVFMPNAVQQPDGAVQISLGAKGVVELELVATGERWGRGPLKDIHSGNRARVDSPVWHLVQALHTLVDANGDPAIEGWSAAVRPPSAAERTMLDVAAKTLDEAEAKRTLGVQRWARDASWRQALEDLAFRPTINIEGLVAGYTGPGGMTILPHQGVAKLDLRLVPDMTKDDAVRKLEAHLAKHGFGDLEVRVTGGYDPTSSPADSALVSAQRAVYRRSGLEPLLWPRSAGSWPGYVFTGEPLKLPAGHFGLGHGGRAHAPDEYLVIEPAVAKVAGWDAIVRSHVDLLYELAR